MFFKYTSAFFGYNFFSKSANYFVNNLNINGFCRLLTISSVNLRKPPFREQNFGQAQRLKVRLFNEVANS